MKGHLIEGGVKMAERLVRMGKVSSVDYENGMVSVTYPDLDDSTTDLFPLFSMADEYKMPGIGQDVLVLHLSSGQASGIVMGKYWNEDNIPLMSGKGTYRKELGELPGEAYVQYEEGNITFHDHSGTVTLGDIIAGLKAVEGRE